MQIVSISESLTFFGLLRELQIPKELKISEENGLARCSCYEYFLWKKTQHCLAVIFLKQHSYLVLELLEIFMRDVHMAQPRAVLEAPNTPRGRNAQCCCQKQHSCCRLCTAPLWGGLHGQSRFLPSAHTQLTLKSLHFIPYLIADVYNLIGFLCVSYNSAGFRNI